MTRTGGQRGRRKQASKSSGIAAGYLEREGVNAQRRGTLNSSEQQTSPKAISTPSQTPANPYASSHATPVSGGSERKLTLVILKTGRGRR